MYIILFNVWRNTGPEFITAMSCAVHHLLLCQFVEAYMKSSWALQEVRPMPVQGLMYRLNLYTPVCVILSVMLIWCSL